MEPMDEADRLELKATHTLSPPAPRPEPPPPRPVPQQAAAAVRQPERGDASGASRDEPAATTWMVGAAAALAGLGWVIERRRRRLLETEKDSELWAHVQPPGSSIITTAGGIDDILPESGNPAEMARSIYVTTVGETNSRREATLTDLHHLQRKVQRRVQRGDTVAAVLLLQQHLVDFRYTSPWVFLELRELHRALDRQPEWEAAREAFRHRFGQNAPHWATPSTADATLLDDAQLCEEAARHWPYREARMFILRWMLGDPDMRQKGSGPPLLPLGVYRDLMTLDHVLDEVIVVQKKVSDSLL